MKRRMKQLHPSETRMFKLCRNQEGYIALLSVIVLGVIGGLIAITLYLSGIQNSQSSLLNIQEKEARYLSDSCSEIAIQQIINITENNSTSSTFNIGRGTCSFTITDISGGQKQIDSIGTIDEVVRKNTVIINPSETTSKNTVNIISWQEKP